MLTKRNFTKEEANRSLVYVSAIVEDIVAKWNIILQDPQRDEQVHDFFTHDRTGKSTSPIIAHIINHTTELEQVGCHLKDISRGVVLFPTLAEGIPGYYLWTMGADGVQDFYERQSISV